MGPFKRFLTLREGSIVVVTVIAIVYFSASTPHFFTGGNFKTLLPYFAPLGILALGEVFVMTLGEIDLSIGAMYLWTPFLFWKLNTAAHFPLVLAVIGAIVVRGAARGGERLPHRGHRHPVVRGHLGHAVRPRRDHADRPRTPSRSPRRAPR